MITLIAAMDESRLIGNGDKLPWHIPEDLKFFKAMTLNAPVVMGRKTYDSLPFRPLPRRTNIVISRSSETIEGAVVFRGVDEALTYAESLAEEIFVIGGSSIYEQTIDIAHRLLITHVDGNHEGSHFFPHIVSQRWTNLRTMVEGVGFRIVEYR